MADNKYLFRIEVDEKGALVKLKALDKGIKDIDLSSKSATNAARTLQKQIGSIGGVNVNKNIALTGKEIDNLGKQMTHTKTATGNFSSAALEAGRIISDMPYGIRGVANNLSQFATNMMFAARQTGSLKLAVKGLWTALKGPLGILLAIQAVIATLDYFSTAQKKVKKDVEDTTDAVEKQITKLEKYKSLVGSLTIGFEAGLNVIGRYTKGALSLSETVEILSAKYSEFRNGYERLTKEQKESPKVLKTLISAYEKYLRTQEQLEKKQKESVGLQRQINEEGVELTQKGLTQRNVAVGQLENLNNEISILLKQENKLRNFFKKVDKDTARKPKTKKEKVGKYFDDDFFELPEVDWVEIDAKLREYNERIREIRARINIESMEGDAMDILNENQRLTTQRTILDAEKQNELEHINFLIGMRKLYNMEYGDLLEEKKLIDLEYRNAEKEIDQEVAENKIETMQMIGTALGSFADLAGENTAAGKALAVASATIDTYAAANAALNDKTVPSTVARVALMVGIIARGLANVKQILSVKVPNSSGGGGGQAPPIGGREFDFNLVGSTGQDQLAQTIGGQVEQPIRAYVVSSEITNQQAFDNQIQGNATIGIGGD